MATRGRKRKLDSENSREGPGEQSGQQGGLAEGSGGVQPGREQGPSQLTVNGGSRKQTVAGYVSSATTL